MPTGTVALAVDFGTSNTVAMLRRGGGPPTPLLFDGSPMLASSVFAGPDGDVLTGADAERAASGFPAGLESNPKRRIADGTVWLGEREMPVVDLVAAVLARVGAEATRVAGQSPSAVVLTHPVAWSRTRLSVLGAAARAAGLGEVGFVAEPVAAAAYFAGALGHDVPVDHCLVVYDLGGGTFDLTVLRRQPNGFGVVASGGLSDLGGLDLDATVVDHARNLTGGAALAWNRLDWPQVPAEQRARRLLWRDAQAVKEQLSRHVRADLHIPLVDTEVQLTREEFDKAAQPLLERTVEVMLATLREARIPRERVAGVFLVGGSSRVPLAASLLHRGLNIAPTVIEQPELVVAEGALHTLPALPPVHVEMPALPPVHVAMPAPIPAPPPVVAAPIAIVPAAVEDRRRRRWLPAAVAAVAAVLVAGAVIVAVNLYDGYRQTANTPPTSASDRPSDGPSVSPSVGAKASQAVHSSANPSSTVSGVDQAKQLISRLPARIRDLHCIAEVTPTTPQIPTVTCGKLETTSVVYAVYPSADYMYEDLQGNLDPSQATGGDCAKTPQRAQTTYTRDTHHGRIICEAQQGSGYIGWTDDTTLVWGQIFPTDELSYKRVYELWTSAVDIAPA
jgi:actin-like ATPase involved in cell morphogenesis